MSITGIPEEMYTSKPLIGVKEKVFETMDQFHNLNGNYLIAYVPDIVWGDTLISYQTLKNEPPKEASQWFTYHT